MDGCGRLLEPAIRRIRDAQRVRMTSLRRQGGGVTATAEIPRGSCHVADMLLADFVHLRVHTAYSLSAGAIPIKELVGLCQNHRMPAVAVTDTGNLFGALEVATTCAAAGVQPIIGCEIAL